MSTDATPDKLATARTTGLLYLAVAVTGGLGFVVLRPMFTADDPAEMLGLLVENEGTVRLVIALELALVLSQALVALWFYRLFRDVDDFAAGAVAAFGMVNAVAILGSAAGLTAALGTALDPVGDGSADVALLVRLSEGCWTVGGVGFGAWLAPMGWLVLRAGLPRALGGLLVVGAAGYVVGTFLTVLLADVEAVATALAMPATVGELWMVGYLLHGGAFRGRSTENGLRPAGARL
jgi:hypothetical protein